MKIAPRHVLLSPKIRRPPIVPPKSSGTFSGLNRSSASTGACRIGAPSTATKTSSPLKAAAAARRRAPGTRRAARSRRRPAARTPRARGTSRLSVRSPSTGPLIDVGQRDRRGLGLRGRDRRGEQPELAGGALVEHARGEDQLLRAREADERRQPRRADGHAEARPRPREVQVVAADAQVAAGRQLRARRRRRCRRRRRSSAAGTPRPRRRSARTPPSARRHRRRRAPRERRRRRTAPSCRWC